ncbi:MAG: ABC transporter permease [Acidimicrobiia bacterium]
MLRVTIKNLFARKFRLVLTSIAVILGVAFMAGTFVLTDTLGNVFDGLFADVNRGVDVALRGKEPFKETAGGPGTQVVREPLDATVLDSVEAVEGVAIAEGSVGGLIEVVKLQNGKPSEAISHGQAPTLGVTWGPHRGLNRAIGGDGRPEVGRRPSAPGEVALDEVTATDAGISPQDVRRCVRTEQCRQARVQVIPLSQHPPEIVDVVAIFRFGTVGNLAGATLAAFDVEVAQGLLNKEGRFDEIHVKAEPGVSDLQLRDRIRTSLANEGVSGVEVLTGEQLATDQSDEIRQGLSFFSIFLLVFAVIALFVGAFIIYNTFSIVVAQRTHELGLLRGLGASGRQVMGSVAIEALIIGLFSSIVGLAAGVGVAIGLQELLKAFDVQLPSGDTVILGRTIIISLVVGTLVTFVSSLSPARRAAAVSPVAAMQADTAPPSSGSRRYSVGGFVTILGFVLLLVGLFAGVEGFPGGAAALVGLASAMVFVGVAMLSPLLASPAARTLGWLPARFRGMGGLLARENASRNPRRTATTAAALMVGISLMTLVAILGSSIKATLDDVLSSDFKAEFVLSTKNFTPLSPEAATAVRDVLPDAHVTEFRFGNFELAGETKAVMGTSPNLGSSIDVHPEPGAMQTFRQSGGMLVFEDAFKELPKRQRASRTLEVRFGATGEQSIPIAGVFAEKDAIGNDYLLAMPDFEANFTDQLDVFVAIKVAADTSLRRAATTIDQAIEPFPSVQAQDQEEFKETQEQQVGQFLNLIYVLLGLAVGIAVLGIANTLALSIYERTREIGLLRAVGMARAQVRTMIRYESIIIAVFGSALGVSLGLVLGRALIGALESEGIHFALSPSSLVQLVLLGAFAGWWASVGPARRAARLDVLEAIQSQ